VREPIEKKRIADRLFTDKTGSYVIGQSPNTPIILAAIGFIGSHVAPQGTVLAQIFSLFAFGAIFSWAYLEIMYGESLFRKILGIIVLIGVFVTTIG